MGNLKTNVVAESASPHSSLLSLHQAHSSRTDRDDQDLIHPLPVDLSSPVVSSKQPLGTRTHEILQTREGGRRNSLRAASEHIKGAPLQALQPGPGATSAPQSTHHAHSRSSLSALKCSACGAGAVPRHSRPCVLLVLVQGTSRISPLAARASVPQRTKTACMPFRMRLCFERRVGVLAERRTRSPTNVATYLHAYTSRPKHKFAAASPKFDLAALHEHYISPAVDIGCFSPDAGTNVGYTL